LGDIIAGLVRYTERHFAREEKLLDETGYPAATQHRRQHEALTYQVLEVQREFAAGTSATISADVLRFLRHWLLDHISLDDKKYGPHLNALEIH
jgi:hemerythrin